MRRLIPLAALVAATIALPAAAQGATLERYSEINGTLLVTGAPDESDLISVEDRPGSVVITDDPVPLELERAGGCERLDERSARCWMAKQVWLVLGDGNDVATIASKRAVSVNGGAGKRPLQRGGNRQGLAGGLLRRLRERHRQLRALRLPTRRRADRQPARAAPVRARRRRHARRRPCLGRALRRSRQDAVGARDGEPDTVDCGGQPFDRVTADPAEASIAGCAAVLVG